MHELHEFCYTQCAPKLNVISSDYDIYLTLKEKFVYTNYKQ